MIRKKDNLEKVSNYRPINLCNVSCKFTSKILTKRLPRVLPKVISPYQSAFVPQRDIHDTILTAHKILSTSVDNEKEQAIWQLNRLWKNLMLDWNFIRKYLQGLRFSNKCTNWIKQCITTTSFRVILYSKAGLSFNPERDQAR